MHKVLFVSHLANFQKFNQPLIKHLRQKGVCVDYVSSNEEKVINCDHVYEVKITRSPFSLANIKAIFKLKKILMQNRYDLIHCHTPMGGVVARIANFLAGGCRTKIIYTAHGFHFFKSAPLLNWLLFYPIEKALALITDAIITINQEDYQLAKQKFKTAIYKIDGVGIDLSRFHPVSQAEKNNLRRQHGYTTKDFIVIYVAEINKNKNQSMIIRNIDYLQKHIPNLKIILVGATSDKKLSDLIAMKHGVDVLGYRNDIDKLFQLADLAISASLREGLATNIIEAMASGLPIVCSNVRGHRDLIQNCRNGYLFNTADDEGMVKSIVKVYQKPVRNKEFIKRNLRGVAKYSQEVAVGKTIKIYRSVE